MYRYTLPRSNSDPGVGLSQLLLEHIWHGGARPEGYGCTVGPDRSAGNVMRGDGSSWRVRTDFCGEGGTSFGGGGDGGNGSYNAPSVMLLWCAPLRLEVIVSLCGKSASIDVGRRASMLVSSCSSLPSEREESRESREAMMSRVDVIMVENALGLETGDDECGSCGGRGGGIGWGFVGGGKNES